MENGPYELLEVIGQGGMGTVYRARCRQTGQLVAVKLLHPEMMQNQVLLRRFEQEFLTACRLRHPNLVPGLDYGFHNEQPYLAMEFVAGISLTERIQQQGPLPVGEAVKLICQVAGALELAHQHHLIHRDVKPENILLTPAGQAKLIDLGLIKDLQNDVGLTGTRTSLGSVHFMAPEQFDDARHVNIRSDIYALGATLYYALTGVLPFRGRVPLTILRKKLFNEYVPLREILPHLNAELERVIGRTLEAESERRHGSCAEFIAALLQAYSLTTKAPLSQFAPGIPPCLGGSTLVTERRSAPRFPITLQANCRTFENLVQQQRAEIVDLSLTGIRLQLDGTFAPGSILSVELMNEQLDAISSRWVRVCWLGAATAARRSLGCVFTHPLSPGELRALLECHLPTLVVPDTTLPAQ